MTVEGKRDASGKRRRIEKGVKRADLSHNRKKRYLMEEKGKIRSVSGGILWRNDGGGARGSGALWINSGRLTGSWNL